ncbi:FGGY family carbohydrate kinase [Lacticaseibacillus suibinensis]|uniref:FGGY family carbohydrate kinase n=1 Tax=Lacticaseibacillus suibinensis TaxID=2486011 RepID=UPI00194223E6|nr:FGGY family carbohydrate kinase [Lacticaseibacillus suibinensis]
MTVALTLAIDQSTQGTKVLLVNPDGSLADKVTQPHRQIISAQGWISHDLNEITTNLKALLQKAVQHAGSQPISGVAISNQRETAAAWAKDTGQPLTNAIVWQDNRSAALTAQLAKQPGSAQVKAITGLGLSPYFSGAKFAWLLRHDQAVQTAAATDNLCFGTIDAWLVALLSGNFLTEPSNACRTQLMNLRTGQWDETMCALFGIKAQWLPTIIDSNGHFGTTDLFGLLPEAVPIISVLGDSQAALFAENCLTPGRFKVTFGTGSSVMLNTGEELIQTPLLNTSIAWRRNGRTTYALEGNVNYSGAIISWLQNNLQLIADPAATSAMAKAAQPDDTTLLIPAFSGLAVPYSHPTLKAALVGMTMLTGRNEIIRAGLDAVDYQITDIIKLLQTNFADLIPGIHVDGGMIKNGYLMQRLSDLAQQPVLPSPIEELSGVGAALNGLGNRGIQGTADSNYQPQLSADQATAQLAYWTDQITQLAK